MRNVKWLVAAALAVSTTGCVETYGYPTTSYGGYPSGYGYSNGYYAQPTYYQQPAYYQPAPQTRYVPVPVAQPAPRPYRHHDRDDDGDRHDWDRNGH
ncbi:MAG TPA: hypothetical protein VF949_07365 [Reyranella sp.]|jgi:hypothetical protein